MDLRKCKLNLATSEVGLLENKVTKLETRCNVLGTLLSVSGIFTILLIIKVVFDQRQKQALLLKQKPVVSGDKKNKG